MKRADLARFSPEIEGELLLGGRLVFYEYCISFVFFTLRRPSAIYLLRNGESGLFYALPYVLLSLLFGWWAIPWGLLYTPLVVVTNLRGGCDLDAHLTRQDWSDSVQ